VRQRVFVGVWALVTGVVMMGWLTGLSWAAIQLVQHLIS
jgi:hypothetical protein